MPWPNDGERTYLSPAGVSELKAEIERLNSRLRADWDAHGQMIAARDAEIERLRQRKRDLMRERDAIEYQRDELLSTLGETPRGG